MEAEKFLKEWKRMCGACSENEIDCSDECGFMKEFSGNRYDDIECWRCALLFHDRAVKAVSDWAAAHPAKTRLTDFIGKYPNAPKREDGTPIVCAAAIGYGSFCSVGIYHKTCRDCWNQPLE